MRKRRNLHAAMLLVAAIAVTGGVAFADGESSARPYGTTGSGTAYVMLGAAGEQAPPANDDFGSAASIAGASGSTTGTNVSATEQTGAGERASVDVADANSPIGKTVWWK